MLMMVFLSIESSQGLAESLQDQHYHCGPEKSCPEACPQRLLNERTKAKEEETEAPESLLFSEYRRNACSEHVDIATGPLQTMSRPYSASPTHSNVVYPTH